MPIFKNKNFELSPFFDLCIKIESACAGLYNYFADLYIYNPDAVQMWRKAALEEEDHQKQFELAYRLLRDVEFELLISPDRPQVVLNKLNSLLKHVKTNPPDLRTALEKCIRMEEQLADLHLQTAANCNDPSVKSLFQKMRGFDMEHVQCLKRQLSIETIKDAEMLG